jgi:NADPH-dependent glutamate synthase beta subunit-like oxidoreductase/ferredoxin
VPGLNYWRAQIKCQAACPVHTDARGYVRAIAAGQDEFAYLIARGPNPLASICGRVCGAPCESACRRCDLDQPIAIRALKRFVCDRFGPGTRAQGSPSLVEFLQSAARRLPARQCQEKEELLPLLQALTAGRVPPVAGTSVGVIGSGPAGLAAAHDLALLGFAVTVYEMEPVIGGMLAVGIPHYRLPRELIRAEVEAILAMGVKAVKQCCVGRDVSLAELRQRHQAVVIAVGAKCSRRTSYPGADAEGVYGGVEFLREVALGTSPRMGRRVMVVGGGDAAMDAARTALRVQSSDGEDSGEAGEQYLAMDAARSASRLGGREVHVVYRRSRAEMPAVESEIEEAHEEGIRFHLLANPVRIEKDERGAVRGMWCQKMQLGQPDTSGRREPVPIEGSEYFTECDNVVMAVGQTYDLAFVDPQRDGLALAKDGRIECDPATGSTSAADVYVAGDLAYGPKLLIHAVASGKAVARTIYQRFAGRTVEAADVELHFPIADYAREKDYEKGRRAQPLTVAVAERLKEPERPVEEGFAPEQARSEAGRCLDCGINTIFDGSRCLLCGGCVDVCPEVCLRIVTPEQLDGDADVCGTVDRLLEGFPAEQASAILKDERLCIRCGLCAERCPVGAITMERFMHEEQLGCRTV